MFVSEIITASGRPRHRGATEKLSIVEETIDGLKSISIVARRMLVTLFPGKVEPVQVVLVIAPGFLTNETAPSMMPDVSLIAPIDLTNRLFQFHRSCI